MRSINNVSIVLLILIMVFNFSACGISSDEISEKFDNYSRDSNVVAVLDDTVFYFVDHSINIRDIVDEDEEPNKGYFFSKNKLYFSTAKQNGIFDYSFFIYQCDIDGSNKTLVFEKHGYKTKPWSIAEKGVFYIEHYKATTFEQSSRVIDSYNVFTTIYETVSFGKELSLSDYTKKTNYDYSFTSNDEFLTIKKPKSNETFIINNKNLLNSSFGEALVNLEYSYYTFKVTEDDRIFLLYRIKSNDACYPHFICEFIPSTNDLVFKSLFFSYDVEHICIEYIM